MDRNLKPITVNLSDVVSPTSRRTWGKWTYDPRNLTLTYGPTDYEIDLERLTTCAAMLDFIFQVGQKEWGCDCVGDLIRALSYLINPQACLCGSRLDRGPIVVKDIIRKRR